MDRIEENNLLIQEINKARENLVIINTDTERNKILLDISKSLAIIASAIDKDNNNK